jgi:signal transduction histidine kinase
MASPASDDPEDPYAHTHELRTTLTAIRLHAQLLLRRVRCNGTVDPEYLRRRAETVDQMTRRMALAIGHLEELLRRNRRATDGSRADGR